VYISEDTAIFYTVNSRKVEIESGEYTDHCAASEHYMEVTYHVKCIVEENVHTCMGNCHTGNTSADKQKSEREGED